jgi:hypothetical protein
MVSGGPNRWGADGIARQRHLQGDPRRPTGRQCVRVPDARSGPAFAIEDISGRVVLRDRGMIVLSYVFDTLGDSKPSGNLLEDPVLVRVSGPHPGCEGTFDFCALATQLIG